MEWHEALQQTARCSDVIFMTAYADLETAIQALRDRCQRLHPQAI